MVGKRARWASQGWPSSRAAAQATPAVFLNWNRNWNWNWNRGLELDAAARQRGFFSWQMELGTPCLENPRWGPA